MPKKKKDKNILTIIAIILLLLILFLIVLGAFKGWFHITLFTADSGIPDPNNVGSSTPTSLSYFLNLAIAPGNVCVGDIATGTISSNMYDAECILFVSPNNDDWHSSDTFQLNNNGAYTQSQVANAAGTAYYRVVCCDSQNNCKVSNSVQVIATVCNNPQPAYTCTDSDGEGNYHIVGNCQDSFHMAGFQDYCSNGLVFDYYCDAQGICQRESKACDAPNVCQDGLCQMPTITPCSSVWNPTQSTCSAAYCSAGVCAYVPATLYSVARCECQIPN
jgi:hypothetical protein